MYLAYFDETGDDGYPKYSSELFVLTSLYMHESVWKDNYNKIHCFRQELKIKYNFPVKLEFHTKQFLTDKNPYRSFNWGHSEKRKIIYDYFELISSLDVKIINVVINKLNIQSPNYDILDRALTYNVQRIENDLAKSHNNARFLIITDEGRVGKMRKITRRVQAFNYIPSKYNKGCYYRQEIQRLIEDPLPKQSSESYFIQIADLISYIVYLYSLDEFNQTKWANRVRNKLSKDNILELLTGIKHRLNLEASSYNQFGIVHYPSR